MLEFLGGKRIGRARLGIDFSERIIRDDPVGRNVHKDGTILILKMERRECFGAFSILLFTETTQQGGIFLRKMPPSIQPKCQHVDRKCSNCRAHLRWVTAR
jgi:hypothetical protein